MLVFGFVFVSFLFYVGRVYSSFGDVNFFDMEVGVDFGSFEVSIENSSFIRVDVGVEFV